MTDLRRDIVGGAVQTALTTGINSSATTISINSSTGWPSGSNGPFYVVVDPGLAGEEKILVLSRSGVTLTVVTAPSTGRGADGTTASTHGATAVIYPCFTATDADTANDHVYTPSRDDHTNYLTTGRHDVTARHAFGAAFGTPSAAADVGTVAGAGSGTVPARSDHTHKLAVGAINSAGLFVAGVVDATALAASSVTSAKILDGTIVTGDIATGAVTSTNILDGTIVTGDIATGAVTSTNILDGTIATGDIANNAVTFAKAATDLQKSASVPWGFIASANSTTDQTGISNTFNSVTGQSVTFTAVSGRRYKITVQTPRIQQTGSGGGEIQAIIADGSNAAVGTTNEAREFMALTETTTMHIIQVETGLSGSVTRKVRVATSAATTCAVNGASFPGIILVEDIGV